MSRTVGSVLQLIRIHGFTFADMTMMMPCGYYSWLLEGPYNGSVQNLFVRTPRISQEEEAALEMGVG
eukprot:65009-Amphidinium_carterae.1